jgi:hypothetical protein
MIRRGNALKIVPIEVVCNDFFRKIYIHVAETSQLFVQELTIYCFGNIFLPLQIWRVLLFNNFIVQSFTLIKFI